MQLPRNAQIWLAPYIFNRVRARTERKATREERVWIAITDHYEPFWKHADLRTAKARVSTWSSAWPEIAYSIGGDSAGRLPRYTFFYPEEEYRPELLDALVPLRDSGIGDVEVHIHHDGDGRQNFIDRISTFCRRLREQHGLLRQHNDRVTFGFIHGNWALDNSLPGNRWCGLNDEISILRDLGCYADFTMPSGASQSQARILNSIYWCTDDPHAPKSHDRGLPVRINGGVHGDLLMITGPFGLRWKERLLPRIETGELAAYDLPCTYRVRRWFDLAPRIGGMYLLSCIPMVLRRGMQQHCSAEDYSNCLVC